MQTEPNTFGKSTSLWETGKIYLYGEAAGKLYFFIYFLTPPGRYIAYCWIEWPQRGAGLLQPTTLTLRKQAFFLSHR